MITLTTPLHPMTAEISWLRLSDYSETELLARAELTPDEAIRYAALPQAAVQRRKEWLAARVLVRERAVELGQPSGRILYEPSGRPYWDGGDGISRRPISISHTAGWAALMVAPVGLNRCGIDIEHTARDASRATRRIASAAELALAEPLYPRNPPLLVWCAKEAAYKALGTPNLDFRQHISLKNQASAPISEDRSLLASVVSHRISLHFFESPDDLLVVYGAC